MFDQSSNEGKQSLQDLSLLCYREPPVETQSKRKEKVDVACGKGIDLLSEVALTEEAHMKEVRKKSLRDFHKSHPSGSGSVAEKPPSVEKITPPIISEGTDDKPRVLDVTKDESTENDDDDDEVKDDDDDKSEGDEDRGMDNDDVQDKKADVRMTDAQQEKENLEITQEQVVEDDHVTITKKTKVPITSSSRSSDLAFKFLNFLDIPPADAEIVSPLDVHVHHEVLRIYTSTFLAVSVSVIPEASPVKNKREKDKIETKPDQIKKKREAWRSWENSKAATVDKGRKTKQNIKEGPNLQSLSKYN
nr:hypothetical protein [Tanacetum cinerariifolium]